MAPSLPLPSPPPCADPPTFRCWTPRRLARAGRGNQLPDPLGPTLPFRPQAPKPCSLVPEGDDSPSPARPAAVLNLLLWQIKHRSEAPSRNRSQLAAKLLNSSWLVNSLPRKAPAGLVPPTETRDPQTSPGLHRKVKPPDRSLPPLIRTPLWVAAEVPDACPVYEASACQNDPCRIIRRSALLPPIRKPGSPNSPYYLIEP